MIHYFDLILKRLSALVVTTDPLFWTSAVGPVVDEEAERDVQPVRLADAASRPPGGADHRQHHGPAGEDHDQQSGQQTGEEQPVQLFWPNVENVSQSFHALFSNMNQIGNKL